MIKITSKNGAGERLDRWLAQNQPDVSRSTWQKRIKNKEVRVNNRPIDPKQNLQDGDVISFHEPKQKKSALKPEAIELDVVFEDDNYAIINKPAGLVVHPGSGNKDHTLVHALLHRFKDQLSTHGGSDRPGLVHRLDKDTSGLLLIAKNDTTHKKLAQQFEEKTIHKEYITLINGHLSPNKGTIDAPLNRSQSNRKKISVTSRAGSRNAITHYEVEELFTEPLEASLLNVKIETGRTHQIRVHFEAIGFPIIGDTTYGRRKANQKAQELGLHHQFLHAQRLTFICPTTEKEVTHEAPLPDKLQTFLNRFN